MTILQPKEWLAEETIAESFIEDAVLIVLELPIEMEVIEKSKRLQRE